MSSFFQTSTLVLLAFLLSFSSLQAQKSITVNDIEESLAKITLKEGLNIVKKLPAGYKIGLIRTSGSADQWVTVSPNGKKTIPVTSSNDATTSSTSGLRGERMEWKCTLTNDGYQCWCTRNCIF